jgi:hypothetical protein
MVLSTWRVVRGLAGLESGRWCRDCGDAIPSADAFGLGEGFCTACRQG